MGAAVEVVSVGAATAAVAAGFDPNAPNRPVLALGAEEVLVSPPPKPVKLGGAADVAAVVFAAAAKIPVAVETGCVAEVVAVVANRPFPKHEKHDVLVQINCLGFNKGASYFFMF